jgi:small conductance mechanosensitive channel
MQFQNPTMADPNSAPPLTSHGNPVVSGTEDIAGKVNIWADSARHFIVEQGPVLLANIILAILIFIIGQWIARIVMLSIQRLMRNARVDETLIAFLSNMVYWALMVLVTLSALSQLGINTTSFAAIIAAAGLAIGLALQGTLSNFASGVMIILFKPFRVGDSIQAGGTKGTVEAIRIFDTLFRTPDNVLILVPNSSISASTITNYSAKPTRRVDLVIGCGYNDDFRAVKQFLEETVASDDRILDDPAPIVEVESLAESCVNFNVQVWVKSGDVGGIKAYLLETIKLGFDERGFTFPFPSRDVYVHNQPKI